MLVTGAAGGPMGATGRVLTQLLLGRGVHVRAFVRSDDDRAAGLRATGAEVDIISLHSLLPEVLSPRSTFDIMTIQGHSTLRYDHA